MIQHDKIGHIVCAFLFLLSFILVSSMMRDTSCVAALSDSDLTTRVVRSALSRWRASSKKCGVLVLSQHVHGNGSGEDFAFAMLLRKHKTRKARAAMSRKNSAQTESFERACKKRTKKSGSTRPTPESASTRPTPESASKRPKPESGKTRPKPESGDTKPKPLRGVKPSASVQVEGCLV